MLILFPQYSFACSLLVAWQLHAILLLVACERSYKSATWLKPVCNQYMRRDRTVYASMCTRGPDQAVHHDQPNRASRTTEPHAQHVHLAVHPSEYTQSCPSHLEHFVLHTLRYEQCVLFLVIYLWGLYWPNYVGYLTVFVFLRFLFKLHTYLT